MSLEREDVNLAIRVVLDHALIGAFGGRAEECERFGCDLDDVPVLNVSGCSAVDEPSVGCTGCQ